MSAASRCPKCDADVPTAATACPACGLSADRFEGYEREPIDAPDQVVGAWQACVAAWGDDGAHERFRASAAAAGAFGFAAQAYRRALRERPGDARAVDGIERIRRMAEAALFTRPPAAERIADAAGAGGGLHRRYRLAIVFLVALLVVAALGGAVVRQLRGDSRESTRSRRSVPAPAAHR